MVGDCLCHGACGAGYDLEQGRTCWCAGYQDTDVDLDDGPLDDGLGVGVVS